MNGTMEATPSLPNAVGGDLTENHSIKIQDIFLMAGRYPQHIQYLMTIKGDRDFISVHEWAARLCHVLMVETGFFALGPDLEVGIDAERAIEMPDSVRIPQFATKISPSSIFSEHGVYTLKYRAILCELEESLQDGSKMNDAEAQDQETNPEMEGDHVKTAQEPEFRYKFSNDINVTMLITESKLNVNAVCYMGENQRPVTHQMTLNIEEFFNQRARMVPVRLRPDQWMRKFEINYARLSVYFKNKFCIHLMDQMDGVVLENRGLFALPSLVIVKILRKSDVQVIIHLGRTCAHFYNMMRDNGLWKFLLKRDFPNEPHVLNPSPVPMPLIHNPTSVSVFSIQQTNNSQPPPPKTNQDDEPDYYEIYKQKYSLKHRRLHRINSFPARFFPTLRIGRRIPSIPFHFDRF